MLCELYISNSKQLATESAD